jgi:hypothetical protein
MSEYTPPTERLRELYAKSREDAVGEEGYREFNRWLADYRQHVIVSYLRGQASEIEWEATNG